MKHAPCIGCANILDISNIRAYKNGTTYYSISEKESKLSYKPEFFPTTDEYIYICKTCGRMIDAPEDMIVSLLKLKVAY